MRMYWRAVGGAALILAAGCAAAMPPPGSPDPAGAVPFGLNRADLDPSVSPCEDFYQYANGGWLGSNPIPPDRSAWSSYHVAAANTEARLRSILKDAARDAPQHPEGLKGMLGTFYATCMDVPRAESEGFRSIAAEMDRLAGVGTREEIVAAMARLMRRGIAAPLWLVAASDPRRSDRMIAHTWQGGLTLPGPEDYLDDDAASAALRKAYRDYAAALFGLTGAPDDEAVAIAERLLGFEVDLARASMTPLEMRDPQALEHPMTLSEARALAPRFDWESFLAGAGMAGVAEMNVSQPEFLRAVDRLLMEAPAALWSLYLRWRLLEEMAPWLGSASFDAWFKFSSEISGTREQPPRWRRCLDATNSNLGQALGRLYARHVFPPPVKHRAEGMIANLKSAFRESLETFDWMGPATRREALAKLERLGTKIGYPETIPDYAPLTLSGSFVDMLLAAAAFDIDRDLSKIGGSPDDSEWYLLPQNTGGGYIPSRNQLEYPAGKLQPPFFHVQADDALNYGAIGATISHEIIHAFDDEGRQYDARGNLRDWWTAEDAEAFRARAAVLVRQFGGYAAVDDLRVNGELTLGENIADLGGVGLAYRAFRKALRKAPSPATIDGFTPEQRFFLSWARNWRTNVTPEQARQRIRNDVHAPPRWRTNGPLSQMPEFAGAFSCKVGDPMVRTGADAVRIW